MCSWEERRLNRHPQMNQGRRAGQKTAENHGPAASWVPRRLTARLLSPAPRITDGLRLPDPGPARRDTHRCRRSSRVRPLHRDLPATSRAPFRLPPQRDRVAPPGLAAPDPSPGGGPLRAGASAEPRCGLRHRHMMAVAAPLSIPRPPRCRTICAESCPSLRMNRATSRTAVAPWPCSPATESARVARLDESRHLRPPLPGELEPRS